MTQIALFSSGSRLLVYFALQLEIKLRFITTKESKGYHTILQLATTMLVETRTTGQEKGLLIVVATPSNVWPISQHINFVSGKLLSEIDFLPS